MIHVLKPSDRAFFTHCGIRVLSHAAGTVAIAADESRATCTVCRLRAAGAVVSPAAAMAIADLERKVIDLEHKVELADAAAELARWSSGVLAERVAKLEAEINARRVGSAS